MTNTHTLQAVRADSRQSSARTVAIPVKHLPYLRFLSVVLNKPLNEVAARFLKQKR